MNETVLRLIDNGYGAGYSWASGSPQSTGSGDGFSEANGGFAAKGSGCGLGNCEGNRFLQGENFRSERDDAI